MILNHNIQHTETPLRDAITKAYRMDETICVHNLLRDLNFSTEALQRIQELATQLIIETRKQRKKQGGLDAFLHQYDLSSDEGVALMCLAEALLRVPDNETIHQLISDKLTALSWEQHLNKENSLFVNAATWSLMLTGKIFGNTEHQQRSLGATLKRLFSRAGEAFVRPIVLQGMKIIGKQFVMGQTIQEALKNAKKLEKMGYRYSYDMLGEAARTKEDAEKYFKSYLHAIEVIGQASKELTPITGPGISVKLSALHPRYELQKREVILKELVPIVLTLAKRAKENQLGLTIDAEEADRLDLSLDVIQAVFCSPELDGWEGFGLAVQSYQKRAPFVIDWLIDLAKQKRRRWMIRLIKGAYWDAEIKTSQVLGLEGYPVFTRKNSTDVSFIACAKKIIMNAEYFYPQFGTHNAHSVATILELLKGRRDFEFQCLHGMGEPLYNQLVPSSDQGGLAGISPVPCRIYAPVGSHKDLLGYLVRRLLENGANTSFINRLADEKTPIEKIIADPIFRINNLTEKPHPHIPLPRDIFKNAITPPNVPRLNSQGLDLTNMHTLSQLKLEMDKTDKKVFDFSDKQKRQVPILSPGDLNRVVGFMTEKSEQEVEQALINASHARNTWGKAAIEERAACFDRAAALFEKYTPHLMTLLCREAGKQIADCLSEVRETIDYCRYYAARARIDFTPHILNGPTGEYNELTLHPRGVIACISPWNFPLAIFAGQIIAGLVTGNAVIAKPAEQTPLIAFEAARIFYEAGIPKNAFQVLPGAGAIIGKKLVADPRIDGIMFTGSTETAKTIQQTLAERKGTIVPFIAETGGQNAMIVDSSALPEQVILDVMSSAFNSAGQRCSALRVLYLQEDIAPSIITMLKGAMAELTIGDPSLLSTDIGPVIDKDALQMLQTHAERMEKEAKLLYQVSLPTLPPGHYFAPRAFELPDLSLLPGEVFGPILHVIRYPRKNLSKVLEEINHTGYGLTLGIHSRINTTIEYIKNRVQVGNIYVNRNIIGAVVGVQPFGGEKLSGTGPKAGGPHYLPHLCVERAISINTTAAGGNTTLVSLNEEC